MVDGKTPSLQILAQAGVARISFGAGPYLQMMKSLAEAARLAAQI
jgi:2-methylisocitrate lyase-like PEP mutase family enzyme